MDPVPQLLQMRPDLPMELDNIITRAMAKERDQRYSQASEISSALTAVTTKQTRPSEIQSELAAIRAEISQEKAEISQEKSDNEPNIQQTVQAELKEEPVSDPLKPTIESRSGGLNIPVWVYALLGVLLIACFGITGIFAFRANQQRVASQGTSTAIAIAGATNQAESAIATAEQATINAIPPTDTPTNTPEPTANAHTNPNSPICLQPKKALMPQKTATEAESTRASLIETRTAEATLEEIPEQTLLINNSDGLLFGPSDGALTHETDNLIKSTYAEVSIQDFLLQATFITPYETAVAGWDFGVTFRQQSANDELRLVVRSDGEWNLNNRNAEDDNFVQDGFIEEYLNFGTGSSNSVVILAIQETGYFFP